MNCFQTLFVHYPNFQIIVCKDCKSAVVPNQVKTHLKQSHGLLTTRTRGQIAKHVDQLHNIAYKHEDVHYPAFEEEAIPELGPALEGCFQCKECGSFRESKKGIEKHVEKNMDGPAIKAEEAEVALGVSPPGTSHSQKVTVARDSSNSGSGPDCSK